VVELRQHQRTPVDLAVQFAAKGSSKRVPGRAKDLSIGGMYLQTATPLPFGTEVVVEVLLPGQKAPMALPAVVRWTRATEGMGLQFGLLGARETHAITALSTKAP
jgi:type IV pilus assembly protein PilZ